eukprot:a340232_193.p1 GENE.a340232_193~~a340232_193.p1  ORF type:complete len:208 (+),score=61.82 a340232_193:26-625(+)
MADPNAPARTGLLKLKSALGKGAAAASSAAGSAKSMMDQSGATAVLSSAGSAAASAASAAKTSLEAVLPDEVVTFVDETGAAVSKRAKALGSTLFSADFHNFLKAPSVDQLLLHPEYLLHSIQAANAVRNPVGASLAMLTGGVMDVSKDRIHGAAAGAAGSHISEQSGGLIPESAAADLVRSMSPAQLAQAVKLMGSLS